MTDNAHHLRDISPVELAWLAGIIEGEGTFVTSRRQAKDYPKIAVSMTDEDVIRKFYAITGAGGVYTLTVRGLMTKPSYVWALSRKADVQEFCSRIAVHLGLRRTRQMRTMLSKCDIESNIPADEAVRS